MGAIPARTATVSEPQLPGVPLHSGFRHLTDEEQEQQREASRRIQRKIQPFIDDVQRCRVAAMADAHNFWIG